MARGKSYDWIYFSPHLDDAALSCGGQIYHATQAGERVLIVTITAGDPLFLVSDYAASLHSRWELMTDASAARRAEDLAASAILGAEALHWSVPDCIYRVDAEGKPFYVDDADIFGDVAPAELHIVEELAVQMQALPVARQVVAPLAVGHHVDHQLTRQAAELAFGLNSLLYYEDYPYAQQPGKLDQVIGTLRSDSLGGSLSINREWVPEIVMLDATALRAKFAAVAAFRSQVSTFFRDQADLETQVGGYAAMVGGERRWRRLPVVK
jgi:LmbE family N-acetylglucosaminyl deacetylase